MIPLELPPLHPADGTRLQVRMGEMWLKGRNRDDYFKLTRQNLQQALSAELTHAQVMDGRGRLYVQVGRAEDMPAAIEICADIPGLVDVSPVRVCPPTMDEMEAAALQLVGEAWAGARGSFAIDARRTQKTLPFTSPEMGRRIGAAVQRQTGLSVNLSSPDHRLSIEASPRHAHLWVQRFDGARGLPVGSAGGVLLLLSGGIDSPVAGYLAQKRGCRLEAVYFHSPPFIGPESQDKVEALGRRLAARQAGLALHVVPFSAVQLAIKEHCNPRMTVLLYRRFMYRIADALAERRGLLSLVTGESLGQVASQTLENLTHVDRIPQRMTLRPLLTADKHDTIALARRIGTYGVSKLPHPDCCTLFLPDKPVTRCSARTVANQEARLDVEGLVAAALDGVETIELPGGSRVKATD